MTLQEYIDFCLATVAARRQAEQQERDRQEIDFQAALAAVIASIRQRLAQAIPQPLRQFVSYAGGRPTLQQLQGYPTTWSPADFKVVAPGLAQINFSVAASDTTGPMQVVDIKVGQTSYGTDWIEAVAAAATP